MHPAFIAVAHFLLQQEPAVIGTGLLFAAGLHMIYGDDFALGTSALAVAAAWGVMAWLLSSELQKRKPKELQSKNAKKIERYRISRRRYLFWKWSIPSLIIVTLILAGLFVNSKREARELSLLYGILVPANDPFPPNSCGNIDQNHIAIFLGSQISVTSVFPHKIVEVERVPRVVVDRDKNGRLILIVDILSEDGKVIARLDRDGFVVNQNNFLRMKRDDRSSLSVEDQYGHLVLKARYLNSRALSLQGVLHYKNRVITFTENGLGNCFVDSGNADIAINPDIAIN
jgi:hypothetical protein